jgi:hypothetical protein
MNKVLKVLEFCGKIVLILIALQLLGYAYFWLQEGFMWLFQDALGFPMMWWNSPYGIDRGTKFVLLIAIVHTILKRKGEQ